MIRIVCAAALFGLGLSFVTIEESNARPMCYRSKNCVNQVSFADCHNCRQRGNKSWRSAPGAACQAVRNC